MPGLVSACIQIKQVYSLWHGKLLIFLLGLPCACVLAAMSIEGCLNDKALLMYVPTFTVTANLKAAFATLNVLSISLKSCKASPEDLLPPLPIGNRKRQRIRSVGEGGGLVVLYLHQTSKFD